MRADVVYGASPWYRLQAVNVAYVDASRSLSNDFFTFPLGFSDVREVYATTDFFKVEGEILPTTRL